MRAFLRRDPVQHGGEMIWCNGRLEEGLLAVSASDRGLCQGLGVFETLLVIDGMPVAWDWHLERMERGVLLLGLRRIGRGEWLAGLRELLEVEGLMEGRVRVRMTLSGGLRAVGDWRPAEDGVAWIQVGRADEVPEVLAVATSSWRVMKQPLSGCKVTSYAGPMWALAEAKRAGVDEALILNEKGRVAELTTANLVGWLGGRWVTPDEHSGALDGVTRRRFLGYLGREVEVREVSFDEFVDGEWWAMSSVRGPVPLGSVDGLALGRDAVRERWMKDWWGNDCYERRAEMGPMS